MARDEPSTRLPTNDCRRCRESPVAAARSRRSKRRFEPGIPICKGCAWRWRIGTQSCGCCKATEVWPLFCATFDARSFVWRLLGVTAKGTEVAGCVS
jgi:hypothetical protein